MFSQPFMTGMMARSKFHFLEIKKTFNCCSLVKIGHCFVNMTMPVLLTILLMIPLISCQNARQNIPRQEEEHTRPKILSIPRWYAELPVVSGCRFAYGYGGIYLDETRQKESIVKNGSENMAKNESVLIKAGWAGSQSYSQGLNASYVLEKGWEDRASVLEKKLKIVREYPMGKGIIALCAFCQDESLLEGPMNQIDDSPVNVNNDGPPEWINKPKSHPEYVYGIGTAQSQIKPGKAWEEAERQARADLALTLGARYNILQKTISDNTGSGFKNLSETNVEIALKDVAVIRHAYSHASKSFYVLVRMPISEK
jgi:hypothetical protein